LKGVSLDLGIIEDAGFVAERADAANNAKREGFVTVKLPWLFRLLAHVIANPPTSPDDAQVVIGLKTGSNAWSNPLFRHLAVTKRVLSDTQLDAKAANSAKDRIAMAESPAEMRSIVLNAVTAHVSKLLAVPTENIAIDLRLTDLGADSLVAVELRSWIKRELEADVKVLEILGGDSIGRLIDRIFRGSKLIA
jgi:acyl carrier protein